ncbi:MAG: hypothetical protein NTX03_15410 [Bacteroidetes bacterium]|nr:hypothetical protein [Bacteroidota bacterium]
MYDNRSKIILFVVLGIGFLFFLRLMYVQVVDTEYKQFAEDNALRKQIIIPPRGLIFDRKGKLIVNNETIYDVMVIPGKVREDFDTSAFCKLLDVDKAIFIEDFKKAKEYSNYRGSAIIRQISREDYGRLQERLFDYKGFYVESRTARTYPNAAGAHILGYLGEVNDKDIKDAEDAYYRIGDYQGKSGLEKKYENELRGVKGFKNILVDVLNRKHRGNTLHGHKPHL